MLKNKFTIFKRITVGALALTTFLTTCFSWSIPVSAHNAYFLSITIDESNFKYAPVVVYEENTLVANNHGEAKIGDFSSKTVNNNTGVVNGFKVPVVTYGQSDDKIADNYKNTVASPDGDKGLVYTFPGDHIRTTNKRDAGSFDNDRANFMAENLVSGLNGAIDFCASLDGRTTNDYSVCDMKKFSAQLANASAVALNGGHAGVKIKDTAHNKDGLYVDVSRATSDTKCINGTKYTDYVKLTSGTTSATFLARAKKGYQESSQIPSAYKQELLKVKDPLELNWRYIVLQGNYNADVKRITFSTVDQVAKPSGFEKVISSLFSGLLNGLISFLHLYTLNELFLNAGNRDNIYYYGIMPLGWMSSASVVHLVCEFIAIAVLSFALVKLLMERQLATINASQRKNLMDGFRDIILTVFMLIGFVIVFNILIRLNYKLVKLFSTCSTFSSQIGTTLTMPSGFLATIAINFVFFFLTIYYNFVYVLRAFTIAVLYAIAPIAIVSIAFGGKIRMIFGNFLKELIGNIFTQSIHAVCTALFMNISSSTSLSTFELLCTVFAFKSITDFVRQGILGLPNSIMDEAQQMTSFVGQAGAAFIGGAAGALSGKFAGSGGGSGASKVSGPTLNNDLSSKAMSRSPILSKADKVKGDVLPNKVGSTVSNEDLFTGFVGPQEKTALGVGTNSTLVGSYKAGANSKLGKAKQYIDNINNNKGKILKNGLSLAGHSGMAFAKMSCALGSAAIGDKRTAEMSLRGSKASLEAFGNVSSHASVSDVLKDQYDSAGISELYDNGGDFMTAVYDTNKAGRFVSGALAADTPYSDNMQAMYDAFNGTGNYNPNDGIYKDVRLQAVKYYSNLGIRGIDRYQGDKTAIIFNKNILNKKNATLRDIGNIPIFDASKYMSQNKPE